jgi:hypothetical protein
MRLLQAATLALALLLPMAAMAGRGPTEPPAPAIKWGAANEANLRAMARPADLAAPAPATPSNGRIDAAAVQRLLDGKVTDLRREGGTQAGGSGAPR